MFWQQVQALLAQDTPVVLLWVVANEGSSPGRAGFHMAVGADGSLHGTIGGGVMEHKLVEWARAMLERGEVRALLKQQYHDKAHPTNQSGMICSGWQTVAFLPLFPAQDAALVGRLAEAAAQLENKSVLRLSPDGIELRTGETPRGLEQASESDWAYTGWLREMPVIHIIGGGHTSLSLSEVMRFLGFWVKVYDDRPELNTLVNNPFAHEKHWIDYAQLDAQLHTDERDFVVIMTIGYRPDKLVLRQLLPRKLFYLGLLGSKSKIQTLLAELEAEGIPPSAWAHVFTPIGLDIASKTTPEIAISIAAEIIREKNKHDPSQRGRG